MKAVFRTIIYGAIFISFCTVAMCMETSLLLDLPFNSFYFYLTVFSATLGQYNIHYFIKKSGSPHSDRFRWSLQHRNIHLILNVIGAIGLIIGFLGLKPQKYIVLAIIAAITIVYSFPFLPLKNKKRLKDFGLLKILTLSFVWTLITVWFPVASSSAITNEVELIFIHRFIFIFILCLPFDIRDMESDHFEGIRTIPNFIGKKNTYQLTIFSLIIFLMVSFVHYSITREIMIFIAMTLSAIVTYFMIRHTKREHSDFFYLSAVDGMMLLQPVLIGAAFLIQG